MEEEVEGNEMEGSVVEDITDGAKEMEGNEVEDIKVGDTEVEENRSKIQAFRSLEEAYAYIKNYEIATNNKFVRTRVLRMDAMDVESIEKYRIFYNFKFFVGKHVEIISDGMPLIVLGYEDRFCQYGPKREKKRKERTSEAVYKNRNAVASKKVGCTATVKIKKVLKFPEFFVEKDKLKSKTAISKALDKMKSSFSDETKRYIQVYVHIDTCHKHDAVPVDKWTKAKPLQPKTDKGCNRVPNMLIPASERGTVLKRLASLRGKDLSDLAVQFKTASEFPRQLARPKANQKLEDMNLYQLMGLYHEITGQVPNEMFTAAEKVFTVENLRLLLHLCILFANAAGDEQTHPSVRVKGTETLFTPVECYDVECALIDVHMHCPFCPRTDSYVDEALLKAHYAKQHVDKALEFAGLKILRCYDNCEVAGKYRESKTFRGGHWHCYKCSNAVASRADTFLHYRRHLNAYSSSFQIQVAADVNPLSSCGTITHEIPVTNAVANIPAETYAAGSTHPYSPARYVGGRSPTKRRYDDTGLGGTIDHSVVYVEEDEMGNVLSTFTAQEIPVTGEENVVMTYREKADVSQMKARIHELEVQNKKLERDNLLHVSYIEFLEKKNTEQAEMHKAEKEILTAENELLKSQITTDDTHEVDANDAEEDSSSIGAPVALADKQTSSFIGAPTALADEQTLSSTGAPIALADKQTCSFIGAPIALADKQTCSFIGAPIALAVKQTSNDTGKQSNTNAQTKGQGPSMEYADSVGTVADQLSSLRKEMEILKSSLRFGMNFGTNPVAQNPAPLLFVPNQSTVSPFQYIIPPKVTGFANTTPLNVYQNVNTHQNTSAVNVLTTTAQLNNSNTQPLSTVTSSTELANTATVTTRSEKLKTVCVHSKATKTAEPNASTSDETTQNEIMKTGSCDSDLPSTKTSCLESLTNVTMPDTTSTTGSARETAVESDPHNRIVTDTAPQSEVTIETSLHDIVVTDTGLHEEIITDTDPHDEVEIYTSQNEENVTDTGPLDEDVTHPSGADTETYEAEMMDVETGNESEISAPAASAVTKTVESLKSDSLSEDEIYIATPLRTEAHSLLQNEKTDSLKPVNVEKSRNTVFQTTTISSSSTNKCNSSSAVSGSEKGQKTTCQNSGNTCSSSCDINTGNSSSGLINIGNNSSVLINTGKSSNDITNMQNMYQSNVGSQNAVPMMIMPNQNYTNPFISPPNVASLFNTAPLNVFQNTGAASSLALNTSQNVLAPGISNMNTGVSNPNTLTSVSSQQSAVLNFNSGNTNIPASFNSATGAQSTDPFVIVHNQNGSFLVPKSQITGVGNVPMFTTSAANQVPSNTQKQTPSKDIENTSGANQANSAPFNKDFITETESSVSTNCVGAKTVKGVLNAKVTARAEMNAEMPSKGFVNEGKSDFKSPVATKAPGNVTIDIVTGSVLKKRTEEGKVSLVFQKYTHNKDLENTNTSENDSLNTESVNKSPVTTRASKRENVIVGTTSKGSVSPRLSSKGFDKAETPGKRLTVTESAKVTQMNTRSKSKGSRSSETHDKDLVKTGRASIRPIVTRSSSKKSENVCKESATDNSTCAEPAMVQSVSFCKVSGNNAERGSGNTKKEDSQKSNDRNVIVLKVKGDIDKETLTKFLQRTKINLKKGE